ncbi:MAG TPA: tetratricopeptide repeat protein [Candidatus Acidoferrales bacterium]|nr:tetratricopeptide repeat protein [Candidatus Acidoferrales bacterium]
MREYVCFYRLARVFLRTRLAPALLLFFLLPVAYGQRLNGQIEPVDCTGTVQPSDSGAAAVELDGEMGMSYRAPVDGSGFFRLNSITPGDYRARVLDTYGNPMETFFVEVRRTMPMLELRLPEVRQTNRGGGSTISMALLQHKVPGKAQKELELAMRAKKKNDTGGAIDHLQKALALDPRYMQAHNNLGVCYIATGRAGLALGEFQKALEMDPADSGLQANVAAALLGLHQAADAERAARRSVELNGANPRAHYLLALAMLEQGRFTPEVEKHLRDAAPDVPRAHFVLGTVLIDAGRLEQGAEELRSYLASGMREERAQAQAWLSSYSQTRGAGPAEANAGGTDRSTHESIQADKK